MSTRVVPSFLIKTPSRNGKDRPLVEAEFAETWEYFQASAYRTARWYGASQADAEDIAQETGVIVLRRVREQRVAAAAPVVGLFVRQVTTRLTLALHRRAKPTDADTEVPSDLAGPERTVWNQLDLEAVDEVARATLTSDDLEVILGKLNGERSDEVAERLGSTQGAVRARRSRALDKLRKGLKDRLNLDEAA